MQPIVTQVASGARLVIIPMRERTSCSAVVILPVGARHDPTGHEGISHFLEHVLFKGTRAYPAPALVAEAIEGVGGDLDAATDEDTTALGATLPSAEIERALIVLADVVTQPLFETHEIERERRVVVEELRMYEDSPSDNVYRLLHGALFGDHALGRDVAGTEETVLGFSARLARSHWDRYYDLSQCVIAVAGDVDAAAIEREVDKLFVAGAQGGTRQPLVIPTIGQGACSRERDGEQLHIALAGAAAPMDAPTAVAESLMEVMLGGGMSSRLFMEVRERAGLAYDVSTFVDRAVDYGLLGAYAACDPDNAVAAVTGIGEQMLRLAHDGPSDAEVERARRYSYGGHLMELDLSSGRAGYAAASLLLRGRIKDTEEIRQELWATTRQHVQEAAQRLCATIPAVAADGPMADAQALQGALGEALGLTVPTPIKGISPTLPPTGETA